MLVDVVFIRQGSADPLLSGLYEFAWREGELARVRIEKWKESLEELDKLAAGGEFAPVEVFLCLKIQQLRELINRDFTGRLVETARNHSRGASVYVVVDNNLEPAKDLIELQEKSKEELHLFIDSLCDWFADMYKYGATDIIQTDISVSAGVEVWEDEDSLANLRVGADRSRRRREALYPEGNWKGLLRRESRVLRLFLERFDIYLDGSILRAERGNWVTIIEEQKETRQRRLVDKAMLIMPDKHLVAVRCPWPASDYISQLSKKSDLKIVRYCGSFELRYLFHLLNDR
jgi:hypothetical protein